MQLCIQLNAVLMGTGHSHTLRFPPLDFGAEFDQFIFVHSDPFTRYIHLHLCQANSTRVNVSAGTSGIGK